MATSPTPPTHPAGPSGTTSRTATPDATRDADHDTKPAAGTTRSTHPDAATSIPVDRPLRPRALRRRRLRIMATTLAACLLIQGVLAQGALAQAPLSPPAPTPRHTPDPPRETIEDFPLPAPHPEPRAVATPRAVVPSNRDLRSFLAFVLDDITTSWERQVGATGTRLRWYAPGRGPIRTGCGMVSGGDVAHYCPIDDQIVIAIPFARLVWANYGDMGVAVVLAHEYGHNLQSESGVRRMVGTPDFELQADCLAGAWARTARRRGLLDPGDLAEARMLFRAIGDDALGVAGGPDPHGTSRQRVSAFVRGLRGRAC